VVDLALSERGQEPKQLVIGLKSFCFLTCGRHLFECLLFESKVRFDITMRCLSALVTEPQCYHCDVNSRLEKMHSTCVSNQSKRCA
jgi:hypothetical protein